MADGRSEMDDEATAELTGTGAAAEPEMRHAPVPDGHEDRLPFDGVYADVIREVVEATRTEARASTSASQAVDVRAGRPVGASGADRLWSFELDADVEVMPETPAKLLLADREPLDVRVLAVGDTTVVLGAREDLGEVVDAARLSLEAGFVLDALARRLEHLALDGDLDVDLLQQLLLGEPDDAADDGFPMPGGQPLPVDEEQDRAASQAIAAGLRFTWGPPGTGKTRVLAMAVAKALDAGRRVMVLAHANAAVDVAIRRIAEQLEGSDDLDEGRVLRVGTPQSAAALDHPEVLPDRIVDRQQPHLVEQELALEARRRELSDRARTVQGDQKAALAAELKDVRTSLQAIRADRREAVRGLISNAKVVAATLAKSTIDEQLWSWPADVVIVDEASMVNLPFLVALAARGATTLSCFGDFRQLPPVAVSQADAAQRWFGRDVFELAGVVAAHEEGRADTRVSTLHTQFRMGEQICETINRFAYDGLLATDATARDRAIRLAEHWPSEGAEVVLVDTGELAPGCLQESAPDAFSRFSPLSAVLAGAIGLAAADAGAPSVGLISPYRAQTTLLAAAAHGTDSITGATIHRFQGSERDVVVLDLVDSAPELGPSRLTGKDDDLSLRLLNVAASRARGKLVVVADLSFVEERHPLGSQARRFVEAAEDAAGEVTVACELLGDGERLGAGPVAWFASWDAAASDAAGQLSGAGADVHVPDLGFAGAWLERMVTAATEAAPLVLRAPGPVVRSVEHLIRPGAVEVQLRPRGPMPWIIQPNRSWSAGATPEGWSFRCDQPPFTRALARLLDVGGR